MESSKWLAMMVLLALLVMLGVEWSEGCLEEERLALFRLKSFFPFIDYRMNYLELREGYSVDEKETSSDCCQWKRVECDPTTGRITHLYLKYSKTEAGEFRTQNWYLNASLFLPFEKLQNLSLRGNFIAGCVDKQGFGRLSSKLDKLEILDLSDNNFNDGILASLSQVSSLTSLNLASNQFIGSNPSKGIKMLSKLSNLEILDLSYNSLGNNILPQLGGFASLISLRLQDCGLKGTLEVLELSNLMNLKDLYLGFNRIESLRSFFHEKGQLRLNKLEVLDLSENLFNNSIFTSLGMFPNLKSLYLDYNNLKGPIDVKELNGLSNLEELSMSCDCSDCSLSLQSFGLFPSLKTLSLGGFSFNQTTMTSNENESTLKSLSFGGYELKGPIDIKELNGLSNLEELSMSCFRSGCSLSLQSFGLFSSLKTLSLGGFNFNQTTMTSTENELNGLSNLEELNIYCFGSDGGCSLPLQSFGLFPSLKTLSLERFSFSQKTINYNQKNPLPLKNLEFLDIHETSFGSNFLQEIGAMPSIKVLRIIGSGMNDTLYTKGFCGSTNLRELVLVYNNLKGNLSECFSNFTSLESLDLSENQFSGDLSFLKTLTSLKRLDLSLNEFSGDVSALKNLTSLQLLDLSSNQFSGNVFDLKSLTALEELKLSNNYFQIPSSLSSFFNFSKLKYFDADNTNIYVESEMQSLVPRFQLNWISLSCCGDAGHFPQFLYHQRDLRMVDLSNVNLKGKFPNWLLKNNSNLKGLYLANNSLRGPYELSFDPHTDLLSLDISKNFFDHKIPNEIGAKLPSLWSLNMSKNHFQGNIPPSVCDMNSLGVLDLSDNLLSGGLPEHLAMGCFSLYSLILSNNRFQGQMFSSKFNLTNLDKLQLDGNHFTGNIPDSLSNCSLMTLDLSNNELYGEIPRWMGNMSSLSTLDLSNNKLHGEIPRWMENISSLKRLDLSKNELSGQIPRWKGKMERLREIVLGNNHLEGPLPVEFCQLNLNLKLLDLSVNNISGSLPSCFSPLWISQVHLSNNKLEGPLTNAFRNSTILVTLDLSNNHFTGKITNWIGNLSQLSYLLLNNNHFEGQIPVQLCNLGHLSLIDLSNNNLTGTIPPCLKLTTLNEISQDYVRYVAAVAQAPSSFSTDESVQFTSKNNSYSYKGKLLTLLSGIDLSCNKLTGEIPNEVKDFRNIYSLNLSHNRLMGPIPLKFSELKKIESLDLSHNNLSGNIPRQLTELYTLSSFSVAYNNISGSTPDLTAQFSTFGESSYVGNPLLCGKPLPKNCTTSGPSPSLLPKASNDDGLIDMTAFYPAFVVSYVMVILTIASVLYINPHWRRAWFYHIGAISNRCYYFLEDHILPKRLHCGNM